MSCDKGVEGMEGAEEGPTVTCPYYLLVNTMPTSQPIIINHFQAFEINTYILYKIHKAFLFNEMF